MAIKCGLRRELPGLCVCFYWLEEDADPTTWDAMLYEIQQDLPTYHAVSEKSGPFCPNPRSIITTRVFTTTQILLSRLSRNGLTSLYCLYYRGYKIVYLEVMVLQSVEYS